MKYRGIFEYEYPTEHKPPVSIDVYLHGDCVKGKIIEWEYRPLEQEPKTGHWIILKDEWGDINEAVCSRCDANGNHKWHYCPNCGADMREVEE